MRSMRRLIPVAAALAAASLLASCSTPAAEEGPKSITIGIGPEQLVGTYKIAGFSDQGLDSFSVYDRLFWPEYFPEGSLATGYELSDDRLSVTIDLREGVVFSDGAEFNAETYVEFVEGLVALGEDWGFWALWEPFNPSVEVVDDYTIKWTTTVPINADPTNYPGFLNIVFRMAITSVAALDDPNTDSGDPIESGAYLVDSVVPGTSVDLVKNETYWNADNYVFDNVTLVVFEDDIAALNALKAGQIDATDLAINYVNEAVESGFTASKLLPENYTALYIGDSDGTLVPALGDQRVRQAISWAFDREAIAETVNMGLGSVTSQPWSPDVAEYVEGGDDRYGYDPERARELMAEAGYADGFDLVIPSTTFLGINTWEPIVQQYLGDIGIRVTYESYPDVNAYFTAALSKEYPVLLYPANSLVTRAVFITDVAILNSFDADHPKIDELWDFIDNGDGGEESIEARKELGEYVLDQALMAVFSSVPTFWLTAPGFTLPEEFHQVSLQDFGAE